MDRKKFLGSLFLLGVAPYVLKAMPLISKNEGNYIRLLRHATLVIKIGEIKILVDPMLSPKDAMPPMRNCGNDIRNPMVNLPIDIKELNDIISDVDAVLVTHTHSDHWDVASQNLIDKNKLIFCPLSDTEKINNQGFLNVKPIDDKIVWKGISINRTKGKHGKNDVSGFVVSKGTDTIYIAGDTIWCSEVEDALNTYNPKITVLNAGGARFLSGEVITMTPDDVFNVHKKLPETKIIAVHMDSINHCFDKRTDLKKYFEEKGLLSKVVIPIDGEVVFI